MENSEERQVRKLEAQLTMAEDIIANSVELIDSLLKAFSALGLRIGEDGDIRNEKYLIPKGSEGYDEMKEIIETLKKEKKQ